MKNKMAPVDSTELLKAFKPLLTVLGGIKSLADVPRLSNLMKKYSKKLVSRCTYCSILLSTTPELLECFLEQDGWNLINAWLKDSLKSPNWSFIAELLDLLDKCPMTVQRLKKNDTPKLVKNLVKTGDDKEVVEKARIVVDKWTGLINKNEDAKNGNMAKKKRKNKSSEDDEPAEASNKIRKVKDASNDSPTPILTDSSNMNKPDDEVSNDVVMISENNNNIKNDTANNRPKTAKVRLGKSRSLGLEQLSKSGKGSSNNKKGGDEVSGSSSNDKTIPGKLKPNSGKPGEKSALATANNSSNQSTVKPPTAPKPIHTLKESVGFIEDIVNTTSTIGSVRKRRKSDPKTKTLSSTKNASDKQSEPSNQDEDSLPMDTDDNATEDNEDRGGYSSAGDDSNSNSNSSNNVNSNNNNADAELPIEDLPELDNLIIPEISLSLPLKTGKTKSILCCGRQPGRTKKKVRWREEDRLKETRFFELDETERTNVSKQNFGDIRTLDAKSERQMLQQIRKKPDNVLGPTIIPSNLEKVIVYLPWKLIPLELPPNCPLVEPGSQSEERKLRTDIAFGGAVNSDFFPSKESPSEFNPKEPDSLEAAATSNGPKMIPLEDENLTVTDYSNFPIPQPRTGEIYPCRTTALPGVGGGAIPPVVGGHYPPTTVPPTASIPPRTPGPPIRTPYQPNPGGYVPPPQAGPGHGYPQHAPYPPTGFPPHPPGPFSGPGSRLPPRPVPGYHPGAGGWPPRPRGPPVCRNFLRSGTCRFMARCNYLHQYPPGHPNAANNPHPPPNSNQAPPHPD